MKKTWPKIRRTINHGKPAFLVDARIEGKGERKFFQTREEADGFAQVCRVRRKNEGGDAFDSSELSAYGWTVQRAIRFALDHLKQQAASVPVSDAIERLIAAKTAAGRNDEYCTELKRRLDRFADSAPDKSLAQVTAPDIQKFLTDLDVAPGTWNTYRRDLVTLFTYGIKAGIVSVNEAQRVDRATEPDNPPGIMTPKQTADILDASEDDDMLAFHALGFFAGLRVAEIKRLDWSAIDLAGGYIHISGKVSKTRSRRLVPILPNLHAWLQPIAQKAGPIIEVNINRRARAVREAAKVMEWPDNAMRHSYVSYRLAATNDAAMTALEAGHDQAVLFHHYRELVRPKDAELYFTIAPESQSTKITPITKAQ